MKIVSCFSKYEEIEPLIKAGADELYCAVRGVPSFGERAVIEDFSLLGKCVALAHKHNVKVAVASNGYYCSNMRSGENRNSDKIEKRHFEYLSEKEIKENILKAYECKIDAFIVSHPAIMDFINKRKLSAKIHLSSVQPCFNSLTAKYFIRLGASRIILPNQLSPYEARKIIALCKANEIETEIFDYRFFGCSFINGRCRFHRPILYTATVDDHNSPCHSRMPANFSGNDEKQNSLFMRVFCGRQPCIYNASSLFDFKLLGVNFIKYGTRPDESIVKYSKVKEIKMMVDAMDKFAENKDRHQAKNQFINYMSKWNEKLFEK